MSTATKIKTIFRHKGHAFQITNTPRGGSKTHARLYGNEKTLCNNWSSGAERHPDHRTLDDAVTCKRCRNALDL